MKEEKRAGTAVVRLRGNSHGNKFYGVHGHNVDSAFEIEDSASDNEATDVRLTRDRPDKDLA